MHFKPEQKEQFKEFMFNIFGNSITPESRKVFNHLKGKIIKSEFVPIYTTFLEKYNIPYKVRYPGEHIYFGDIATLKPNQKSIFDMFNSKDGPNFYIKDGQIGICYLEQYEKNDIKSKNIYDKVLDEFFWENRDIEEVGWHSSSVGHHNEFLFDEIKYSARYCYFVVDKKNMERVQDIASFILGYEIEFNYIDVVNEDFDINGLLWFKFKDLESTQTKSSLSYKLLCLLVDSEVTHCIFNDRDGKVNLDIRLSRRSETDARISRVLFRKDLKMVFRSSWEANFARILNYLQIHWEYEKESFELKDGYYFPDFFLPNNVVVEIKGYWDSESRKKVNAFIEEYNGYKLYTIDGDMLINLEKLYRKFIEEWEDEKITVAKEVLPVVGITLPHRKEIVSNLQIGERLYFKRDYENVFDKNAIQVLNENGLQVGFISKDWASIYSAKLDVGMTFDVTIKSIKKKVIMVNVKRENSDEIKVYNFLSKSKSIGKNISQNY